MKDAGFKQDALYLIRADGHIALAADKQWRGVLNKYFEAFGAGETDIVKQARGIKTKGDHSSSPLVFKAREFLIFATINFSLQFQLNYVNFMPTNNFSNIRSV